MNLEKVKITVIGQGYVGLPLAIEFGKKYPTLGFDINVGRIDELDKGVDHTNEATPEQLRSAKQLTFSANINDIKECNIYIVTVPTPIDEFKTPDLNPLRGASKMLGEILKKGDTVIYESTVYPSVTFEEGLDQTIDWYLENNDWLQSVVSQEYKSYYIKKYK